MPPDQDIISETDFPPEEKTPRNIDPHLAEKQAEKIIDKKWAKTPDNPFGQKYLEKPLPTARTVVTEIDGAEGFFVELTRRQMNNLGIYPKEKELDYMIGEEYGFVYVLGKDNKEIFATAMCVESRYQNKQPNTLPPGISLSRRIAENLGIKIGDEVTLENSEKPKVKKTKLVKMNF